MSLRNKRILITAGPTWVSIDNARIISNIATGETGILLAKELIRCGACVTLVLGPVYDRELDKSIKVNLIRFRFFDELKDIIIREIKSKKYDAVIHSAAVSDYKPKIIHIKKIKSGIKNWKLILEPTRKIIDHIKKRGSGLFLVGFKFEPGATKNILIAKARALMKRCEADLVVASSIVKNKYQAYIINHHQIYGPLLTKKNMAVRLVKLIEKSVNLRAKQCRN